MLMTFDRFAELVAAAGLQAKKCSIEHWQILGGLRVVNFYPFAKRGPTYYVQGTASKVAGATVQQAIAAATNVPKAGQMVRVATRRAKANQRRQDRRRRHFLWTKQNGKCRWCENPVPHSEATIDHVIPLSKGGSNGTDNLVMACHECNQGRKNNIRIDELKKTSFSPTEVQHVE